MKFGFGDLCDEIVQLEVLCWCCDVSKLRFGRGRSPARIGSVFVLSVCSYGRSEVSFDVLRPEGREGSIRYLGSLHFLVKVVW